MRLKDQDLDCIRRAVAEELVLFYWQRGEVLLIDKKLVAHGRQPYEPPRKIFAALLADIQESPGRLFRPGTTPTEARWRHTIRKDGRIGLKDES